MSDSVAKLASEVVDNCEKANSIYPSSDMRKQLREKHLLEARASLRLDTLVNTITTYTNTIYKKGD